MPEVTMVPVSEDISRALASLQGDSVGVILYGSHARGDATTKSDIDVLQVVETGPGSYVAGVAAVVAYTIEQLAQMTRDGSLFAWHLRTEGVVLSDPTGVVAKTLAAHPGPAIERVQRRLLELSAVLDVQEHEFDTYGDSIERVGRYLLRTGIYSRSLSVGEPSFSLARATAAIGLEDHVRLVECHRAPAAWADHLDRRAVLAEILGGDLQTNAAGSLEALAVRVWDSDRHLAALAISAMRSSCDELDYGSLPAPLL